MDNTRRTFLAAAGVGAIAAAYASTGNSRPAAAKFELNLTDAEWKKRLSPAQYRVLRQAGTETPGTSPLLNEHRKGIFACAGCALPLFDAKTKFDSGTGWPSFYQPLNKTAVIEKRDVSLGMVRTEVLCRRCGGHLGHVFDDGPPPTGLRYCMNGLALSFKAA